MTAVEFANAALTVSGSVGGAPTGVSKINFDDLALGAGGGNTTVIGSSATVAVSFLPDGQTVTGAISGQYAAPFLSGGNGAGFAAGGGAQANGADATKYLTTGLGQAILSFSSPQQYLGLLWGSIDSYNTLEFYNGSTLVGSLTGTQVTAGANGNQGVNGTLYVNINSDLAFNKVVAKSTSYAFEFDNVAFNTTPVPEPSTYVAGALLALPVVVQGVRRMRNRK
jgi:hypothetical protein